jgi:hypothetical protein
MVSRTIMRAWPLTAAPALSAKDTAGKRLADRDAFD